MTARRAALAALAVLCGCGSSGPHLSKAEYVRRGDAICGRYQAAIGKLGQPTKISEIGPFITKALPTLGRTVAELGRLAPPSGLESQFKRFIDAARATVARARALRDAAAAADAAEVQSLLKQASKAGASRTQLARDAGLDACALQ